MLPQLGVLFRLPDTLQLQNPDTGQPEDTPSPYHRILPFGANKVIERGYSFPLPFGITVIGVENTQRQSITELSVALGKGTAPPYGTALHPLPGVTFDNVVSQQVKFDAWVLPFLNVFGAVGKVDGTVTLDVVPDLDDTSPPPICTPVSPCGSVTANIDRRIERGH